MHATARAVFDDFPDGEILETVGGAVAFERVAVVANDARGEDDEPEIAAGILINLDDFGGGKGVAIARGGVVREGQLLPGGGAGQENPQNDKQTESNSRHRNDGTGTSLQYHRRPCCHS